MTEQASVEARELLAAEYRLADLPYQFDLTMPNERDAAAMRAIDKALASRTAPAAADVEVVARAMYERPRVPSPHCEALPPPDWDHAADSIRNYHRYNARAAIAAMPLADGEKSGG